LVWNRSQSASLVLNRSVVLRGLSTRVIPVPWIENSIPRWSEPSSETSCQSCTLVAKEGVAKVRSSTDGVRFGLKNVVSPIVFRRLRLLVSIHLAKRELSGVGLRILGFQSGWWLLKSPTTIASLAKGIGNSALSIVLSP
jgi:hypothetical protein